MLFYQGSRSSAELQRSRYVRYNQKMLQFLEAQLVSGRKLIEASKRERQDLPRHFLQQSQQVIERTIQLADKMISRHSRQFDLQRFYKVAEAQQAVEMICKILKSFSIDMDMEHLDIKDQIPQSFVDDDRRRMAEILGYVFENKDCEFVPSVAMEWKTVKLEHEQRLQRVQFITDNGIQIVKKISGGVYEGSWHGSKVAVKRLILHGDQLDLEDFAQFYAEVAIMGSMQFPYIAHFYAASKTGLLVMELADDNLMNLYSRQPDLDIMMKIRLLQQAASGLCFVHEKGIVHRDVKSPNFLVVGKEASKATVKLSGFGLAIVRKETGNITVRQQLGSPLWMAPEIYDGKPHTFESDVFSFGIVMYEVMSQCMPYGTGTPDATVLDKKRKGEEPCSVAEGVNDDIREIMKSCCSIDPSKRPSMGDVSGCLEMLLTHMLQS